MKDGQDDQNDETASIKVNLENIEKDVLGNWELENPLPTVPYTLIFLHSVKLVYFLPIDQYYCKRL